MSEQKASGILHAEAGHNVKTGLSNSSQNCPVYRRIHFLLLSEYILEETLANLVNVPLVRKICVATHASRAAPAALSKCHNAALSTKLSLNPVLHTPNSPLPVTLNSFIFLRFTFPVAYPYQKDEWA